MRAKRRLDWTQTARRQYLDQLAWIAERNPTAAQGVQRRIEHSIDLIQTDAALDAGQEKAAAPSRTAHSVHDLLPHQTIQHSGSSRLAQSSGPLNTFREGACG